MPKAHWLVPFQRNAHFVGRESQLDELGAKLSSDVHCQRVAVVGLGGVGKTQIVLEFAYREREIDSNCSIFWIPAINSATFEQAYLQVGQLLQIPGITEKNADVKQLVKTRLSQESAGRWLIIFDNADDTDMLYRRMYGNHGSLALIDYLPSSRCGSIIFTTRNRKAAINQARNNVINVYEMGQAEAKEVLEKLLIQKHILKEEEATVRLLDLLTYLPLAIVQATAFMNENEISISSYIALYENGEDEVFELLSEDFEDHGRYRDTNPIITTWLISFNQIRAQDELAADYLSFMSCLVTQNIPQSLLPPAQSEVKMVKAIGTLTAYSFITKQEIEQSFDMHRLVHLATRNWLKTTQSLVAWTQRALSRLEDVFPYGNYENRVIWTAYLPHALHIITLPHLSNGNNEVKIRLLFKVGLCLQYNGQYIEAEQMYRQTLEFRMNVLGPEHPDTLESMNNLSLTLNSQGKYVEAKQIHRQTLELRMKVLGSEHPHTLESMNNLSLTLNKQGKYIEAEQMHQQTLELRMKVLGSEHPDTLASMNDLSLTLNSLGKYVEAEQMHRQTLKLRIKVLGSEHPDTLTSMNNLSSTLNNQGKYFEAKQIYRQTLELRMKVLGSEHPDTLTSMNNLNLILNSQGKCVEAEQMHRQTLELRMKVLGLEHPNTLASMNNLSLALDSQGKYVEAEQMHRQTLELMMKVLGSEHPDTLISMNNLSLTLNSQDKNVEAEQMHRQTLELRMKVLGSEHPDTLTSMNNLSLALNNQGKYVEAEQIYRQTLELRIKVLGAEHPDTLISMNNLSLVLNNQDKYIEAEQIARQMLKLRMKVLGSEHSDTLASIDILSLALYKQGKYIEAEQTYRQILELRMKVLGSEHPDTLASMNNLNRCTDRRWSSE